MLQIDVVYCYRTCQEVFELNKLIFYLVAAGQSQAGSQTVRWWIVFGVETGREVGKRGWIRIGFVEEQCFQFWVNELWRDSKGCGFGEFIGWVRYLSQCWREFVPKRWDSYGYGDWVWLPVIETDEAVTSGLKQFCNSSEYDTMQLSFDITLHTGSSEVHLHASAMQMQ